LVETATVGSADDALSVQLLVDHLRGRRIDAEAFSPCCAVGVVTVAAAFGAWAMPGRKRDRLVVEEQECVVVRLPLLMPAAAKLERAGDPEIACVEADDLVAAVEDAAVAGPRTPKRDCLDLAQWCNTVTSSQSRFRIGGNR
jgi:hypothetical protein